MVGGLGAYPLSFAVANALSSNLHRTINSGVAAAAAVGSITAASINNFPSTSNNAKALEAGAGWTVGAAAAAARRPALVPRRKPLQQRRSPRRGRG